MAKNFNSGAPAAVGALQGEAVRVGDRPLAEQLPNLELTPPFLLMFHPNRWMVVVIGESAELLPELGSLPVEPGIAHTDEQGDPSLAIAKKTRNNWIILPEAWATEEDTPDKAPGYVRRYRGRRGLYHATAWTEIRVAAGRVIPSCNRESYYAWLRKLMSDRRLPPPDPAIVEALLDRSRSRAERALARDTEGNAIAARLAREAAAKVEALEGISEKQGSLLLKPLGTEEG